MIPLHFERLSRFDRVAEPCTVACPFPRGQLTDGDVVVVCDGDQAIPTQVRTTATWPDGSIKWLLVHFLADLPGNRAKDFACRVDGRTAPAPDSPVVVESNDGPCRVRTGPLEIALKDPEQTGLFDGLTHGEFSLGPGQIIGPATNGAPAKINTDGWHVIEGGPVRAVLGASGKHLDEHGNNWLDFNARVYAWAGKPWIRIDFQAMHLEDADELQLDEMILSIQPASATPNSIRTALATSNYYSTIRRSDAGKRQSYVIDADHVLYDGNEQIPETLHGTFWIDWNDPTRGGLSATIFQPQQNFPKAMAVDGSRLDVHLIPTDTNGLTLLRGMAKTHRMFLHLHGPDTDLSDVNVRSLQFQMPDRPSLPADVYRQADVMENIWTDRPTQRVEQFLIDSADIRTRGYGALHWGDGPEASYTNQGRGGKELVWTNNEYDLPRQALLMYARTGERRMLDYLLVAAEHWMDVDVCHFSCDRLRHRGQVVHSARHATGGVAVCHQWVEGLLDYYHQTGESFALETALGIGDNVLRHLEPPWYRALLVYARVPGWALRTLTALYEQTHEDKWLPAAERIVDHFESWQKQMGTWLSPYTDHTLIRVPFMISVAVCSLTRYHRVQPQPRIEEMILSCTRDMIDHCITGDGRFYYKELPSLRFSLGEAHLLEALACAYDLSGDRTFLEPGLSAFERVLDNRFDELTYNGPLFTAGDAVVRPPGPGPKNFAVLCPAVSIFYRAASETGLL